jgi:hypothetical protein
MEPAADPWAAEMRAGRFERAWEISDRVLAARPRQELDRADLPFHLRAVWSGEPLENRRVLVRCYHGLGDALQYARYVPALARSARSVSVQAVRRLHGLLRSLRGVGELADLPPCADPPHDVAIEAGELPHAFRTTLDDLPAEVPYLWADPALAARIRFERAGDPRLQVGLVGRSGDWDPRRSISARDLERLGEVDGVAWHDLQHGSAAEELRGIRFVGAAGDGLDRLAATIETLDLVITVDTMAAHLAGALATPVWTLLHSDPDWRWMEGRDDSPWYPTMRLFRQERAGDWAEPVERVAAELRAFVGSR